MRSRIRSKDSHDMKQNTLIPYISMLSKAHIIQCQPPEEKIKVRAFYIWEKNGRKEQTKEEEIKDYLLANDIEICKEKLELDDDDEPEIEIFNPEEKNQEIYAEAINAGGAYNYKEKKIYIPTSVYSRRLLLHEMGHYKQHVKKLKNYEELINRKNSKNEPIGIKLLEYHNFLYHENLDLTGVPVYEDYYAESGSDKYRVSYVDTTHRVKRIKGTVDAYKEKIISLNNPFDNKNLSEDEKKIGVEIVNKIKDLAKNNLVEIAYKIVISFYNEYLTISELEDLKKWKDLYSFKPPLAQTLNK